MATPTVYTVHNMLADARRWPNWMLEAALTHYGVAFAPGADHGSLLAAFNAHFAPADHANPATFDRAAQDAARTAHNATVHPAPDPAMRKFVEDYNRAKLDAQKTFMLGTGLDWLNFLSMILIGAQWLARTIYAPLNWAIIVVEVIDLWKDADYLAEVQGKNAPSNMVIKALVSVVLNLVVIVLVATVSAQMMWLPLAIKVIDTIVEYLSRKS